MLELLRETALFRDCTDDQLERVAAACERRVCAPDERVLEARTQVRRLYVVERGAIELRFTLMSYGVAQEIPIDRKIRCDVLGWSAIVEPRIATLSAVAIEETTLLGIRGAALVALCEEDARLGQVVMRRLAEIIAQRFSVVQQMLIDMAQDRWAR